jgi:WhiB family redox-sensing transcriptional regulator
VKRDGREGIIHRTTRGPQMVSVALPRIIVSSALSMTERARAACRVLDPEIWFQGDSPADVARAKAVCDTCPIRSRCLEVAVQNNERFGIFGGLTVPERMSLRAERRKAAS